MLKLYFGRLDYYFTVTIPHYIRSFFKNYYCAECGAKMTRKDAMKSLFCDDCKYELMGNKNE